ncbi:MAG: hypothetical protein WCH43_16670, partial [Verrucomicrobiota bacterium]
SESGLRNARLEVAVNGEPKLSLPIQSPGLEKSGRHKITASIYLDQLEVQPFDIVSYNLRAQRVAKNLLPDTFSPVQFVQIKPFRDDVREVPGGEGADNSMDLLKALKVVQLRLIKENFILAHAEITHDEPEWQSENNRVGSEQTTLEKKTDEVIEYFIQTGKPAQMVDLLAKAKPLMGEAGNKITIQNNQEATALQGKSLGYITEVEKFFRKKAGQDSGQANEKKITDPFEKQKEVELKQRFKTRAGELELLAREQKRLADDLTKTDAMPSPTPIPKDPPKPDPNKIDGTFSERETQESQRVGALLNGAAFVPEVTQHLEKARSNAQTALNQLDAYDVPNSRQPAASSALELQQALDSMYKAAGETAKEQRKAAMRILNDAAEEARNAPKQNSDQTAKEKADQAGQKVDEAKKKLQDAAQAQQETGSEKEARHMADLAMQLNSKELKEALDKLKAQPRNEETARNAAELLKRLADQSISPPTQGILSPEEIAQLIERMNRTRANLEHLAKTSLATQKTDSPSSRETRKDKQGQGQQGTNTDDAPRTQTSFDTPPDASAANPL